MRYSTKAYTFILSRLGHCQRCTRKSLLAAASLWIAWGVAYALGKTSILLLLGFLAMLATTLWAAHVVAFAYKARHHMRLSLVDVDSERRAMLPSFGRLLVFGAAAALSSKTAFAIARRRTLEQTLPDAQWHPVGAAANARPVRLAQGGCQPVSYGCNSCCNNGVSGNYFVRDDCSTGCSMGCGSDPCH